MTTETPEVKAENGSAEQAEQVAGAAQAAKDPLVEMQEKLADAEKKYLYLYSEFENFRRRAERDRLDFIKFGHEGFVRDLLQVQDNFERAVMHAKSFNPEKGTPLAQIVQGVEMIAFQFLDTLKAQGVSDVKSVGSKFDPAFHEAMGEEDGGDAEAGTVIKELVKGYVLHGRLVRAAKVVIAKKN